MRIIDRYVIISFLKNYLISFMVLVGMYVVLDMVFKFDDFAAISGAKQATGYSAVFSMLYNIVDYYAYQCFLFFVQLSGIIPVVAAAFTLMRFSRFNELAAVLAAGVPLLRVAMPIILVSVALNALLLVDQEVVIPRLIPKLVRDPEDLQRAGPRKYPIQLMQDPGGAGLANAGLYDPAPTPALTDVIIHQRDEAGAVVEIRADHASWEGGGWRLTHPQKAGSDSTKKVDKNDSASFFRTDLAPEDIEKNGRRDPKTGLLPVNLRDKKGDSIQAGNYEPAAPPTMHYVDFIEQQPDGKVVAHISADKAVWDKHAKFWRLTNGTRIEGIDPSAKRSPETAVDVLKIGVTPEAIALFKQSDFVELLSTQQIDDLIKSRSFGQSSLLRVKHFRFTAPLMNVVLLLLAIPCVLIREPGRMKYAIMQCLVLSAVCMSGIFMSHQLAGQNTLGQDWANTWPAIMAWMPVFVFLPIAIWLLDRLHTRKS